MSSHNDVFVPLMSDGQRDLPRRVLLFTPHYAPDYGPSAPIFTCLCEDLVRYGYQVTVICGVPHYAQAERYAQLYPRKLNHEYRSGVDLYRVSVVSTPKKGFGRRLLYHFSFNWNVTLASLRIKKPDVIIGNGPVLWSGLPLLVKAIIPKIPFIYTVFDIYPDVLERLGMIKSRWVTNLIRGVEKIFYRKSSSIVVLSKGIKENLVSYGIDEKKIHIIPSCVDIDLFMPRTDHNPLKENWGLQKKFVVLYAGNVGFSQGLETVLDAAAILSKKSRIEFVIVGDGVNLETLKQKARNDDLHNVQFHEFLPYQEVPDLYAAADACLVTMKPELVVESVPSKTYTIMASGKPVVATVHIESEVGYLLQEANCGICVPPKDSQALSEAILRLYSNKEQRQVMAENSRKYAVQHFSRKVAASRYSDLIDECWRIV